MVFLISQLPDIVDKGRLPKKNELGLLAQPKVGRCPEGV